VAGENLKRFAGHSLLRTPAEHRSLTRRPQPAEISNPAVNCCSSQAAQANDLVLAEHSTDAGRRKACHRAKDSLATKVGPWRDLGSKNVGVPKKRILSVLSLTGRALPQTLP
jgi:hypothetical protein